MQLLVMSFGFTVSIFKIMNFLKKKNRPSVKSVYQINKNRISQPKQMLLVLKRTV